MKFDKLAILVERLLLRGVRGLIGWLLRFPATGAQREARLLLASMVDDAIREAG